MGIIYASIGKTKRKKAGRDRQLSTLQRTLLVWLLNNEHHIQETGDSNQKRIWRSQGVPWKPAEFLGEIGSSSAPSTISASLKALADRELIFRLCTPGELRPRTTHVKLTKLGRETAVYFSVHILSRRQRSDVMKQISGLEETIEELREVLAEQVDKDGEVPIEFRRINEEFYRLTDQLKSLQKKLDQKDAS